jgi:hypothetical protein
MRSIKYLNQYLIFSGNESVIYKKINEHEFVAYYADDRGLFTHIETYGFNGYSKLNYRYIRTTEFQSVIKNNCEVSDLWKKYFGN